MTKDTQSIGLEPLEALRTLVAEHGDAFRYSMSKRGRVWLTLTHWDSEKYNTSVELDPTASATDIIDALAVLCVAHHAKCFGQVGHSDTWLGTDATRQLVQEARDVLPLQYASGSGNAPSTQTKDI